MEEKIVQTAGRQQLGEIAPEFAHFNDDVLFGENWNNHDIDLKTRTVITVVALMAQGITDSSLKYHLENAKNHGVTRKEMAAIVTHVAFYAGWPKAWAVFNLVKEVYGEDVESLAKEVNGEVERLSKEVNGEAKENLVQTKESYEKSIFFPVGEPNPYGKFFDGQSYLVQVSDKQVPLFNVTFEPGCRNHWHIHHAKSAGGQMLVCVGGKGFYQEWGKEPVLMTPGTVVNIPAEVKHWHGAVDNSWFSHLAIEVEGEETSNEWLEAVSEEDYRKVNEAYNK